MCNLSVAHNTTMSCYEGCYNVTWLHCYTCIYMQMCKYTTKECTLFYMPHCGIAMYNNLLWANWNPTTLSDMAVIGNRFSSYNERYM